MIEKILADRLNVDISTITDESHIVDDLNADSLSVVEAVSYTHLTLPTILLV